MNAIYLHDKFLTVDDKKERLCMLLMRCNTLLATEEISEEEFREEFKKISFEFQKVNHYQTHVVLGDNVEIVDNMMFIVQCKLEDLEFKYQNI